MNVSHRYGQYYLLFLILFLMISDQVYPQTVPVPVPDESSWNNHDAIIISDDWEASFSGNRVNYIMYSVKRHLVLKILNLDGVRKYSKLVLPEKRDPLEIIHAPEKRNPGYYLDKIKISGFTLKVTDSSGKEKGCRINLSTEPINSTTYYDNRYVTYYNFVYTFDGLAIGDEADISYEYFVPFQESLSRLTSFRFFFHDSIPKKNFSCRLTIDKDIFTRSLFANGGKPDTVLSNKEEISYRWQKTNLAGCLREPGSRPYLSLPYALFTITPSDLLYNLPYSFDVEFVPIYVLPVYFRESSHYNIVRSIDQKLNNVPFQDFWKFQGKVLEGVAVDETGYNQVQRLVNKIADDFEFVEDVSYFKKDDNEDYQFGSYLLAQQLRDIKRFDTYIALVASLKLGYFTAYPVDKRYGVMTSDFIAPMFYSDYLIAPSLKDGKLHFIYPKSSRYGFYLDELPFYFEDVTVRLVHLDDYRDFKKPIAKEFREMRTPKGIPLNNERETSVIVHINLDSALVRFETRLGLKGQYSTLCRGLYLYNYTVPTINKAYSHKIWNLNDQVELTDSSCKIMRKEAPYTTFVTAVYKCPDLIQSTDSGYIISLQNWFPFIYEPGIRTVDRYLDYYPDFQGKDIYTYELRFNRDITSASLPGEIYKWNSFGKLTFEAKQTGPRTILLTAKYLITADKIPAQKIDDVRVIFEQMANLQFASIRINTNSSTLK
jgi:hypothetical protein